MFEFDPFPADDPPSLDALVAALVAGFPSSARDRAAAILREQVLPWRLRSLATHPNPRRLAELVYQDVTERLRSVSSASRLDALSTLACETTADRLVNEGTGLAVARYLADHPRAPAGDAWSADADHWSTLTPNQRDAEVATRIASLDVLVASAPAECGRTIGQNVLHARLALGSARTGSFCDRRGDAARFIAIDG